MKEKHRFDRLVEIMTALRTQCPWDREQTRESLKAYILEETYEVMEAIDHDNPAALQEELGDFLLQAIFQAEIGRERGEFDIYQVLDHLIDKLIRRHPHVFGQIQVNSAQEALKNWEQIKIAEKGERRKTSALNGVPEELPALLRARRLQEKASRVGFDWGAIEPVLAKVKEELGELEHVLNGHNQNRREEEMGDLFFALVNLARFLDINPEEALRKTNQKFISRFQFIEKEAARQGKDLEKLTLEEMDRYWEEAKEK
ncbi:MAG: nucleoside triphosphate pyrophosphohydrolase [Candidatus Tectomicrobia bacterium]|uniref:Nucleoside triphosphate pyrophosphohydrolase n=1 Tax=Tectimicrobiota bacterium TaxID=2528274 RepID=A0A932M1Q4_UNCTE|nr:nucleoside triphosphate pyrophosphohydrolase [Candidatus Tectomicrobia bacterium]